MSSAKVRRAEFQDIEKLEKFYYQAYGDNAKFKYPERWNWHFRDNPFKEKDLLPVYIAENDNSDIVGHTAVGRVRCKIFDKSVDLGWGVDFFVLPEIREKGIGKILQKINQDDHSLFASLSMTDTSKHIITKQGSTEGPSSKLYVRMLSFEKTFTSNIISLVQRSKNSKQTSALFKISEPESANFDEADSVLWAKLRKRYELAVERDAEYLNWRYKMQPLTEHYCCRAYNKNDELSGLIIYRIAKETMPKGGVILELLGDVSNTAVFRCLIDTAEKHLKNLGATQVQIAVSDTIIEKEVQSFGFIKIEDKSLFIHGSEALTGKLNANSIAMLTKGDQDWDEFPRANVFSHFGLINLSKKVYNFKNINNIFLRCILNLYIFSLRLRSKL